MDIEYDAAVKQKEIGNQAYKAQKYELAIQYYSKAIELNPKQHNFYSNRSLCYFNLGLYRECIRDCDASLAINPTFVKALRKKSAACINLLRFEEAVVALKNAYNVERTPAICKEIEEAESFKSNFQRFLDFENSGNYSEALSCISYLAKKIPTSKDVKFNKVECLANTGDLDEANRVLSEIPSERSADYQYLKGILALYKGDTLTAKKYFNDGLRSDARHAKCQQALNKSQKCEKLKEEGNNFIKLEKFDQAAAKYTEALNLDPYNKKLNSVIYSNRALALMKKGDKNKALTDLNKSLELDPNYTKSLVRRAEINMEKENYSDAIADFGKIQELDPSANYKAKIDQARKKEKQAKKKDYYAILGLKKDATDADIKKAYKGLALKYHPDRNRGKTEVEQEDASKKFKDIVEANGVLTDPEKKRMYDSGQIQFDGDQGAGFDMSGMGGNGTTFTFSSSGGAGIDASEIFKMFQGSGLGGFSHFGRSADFGFSTGGNNNTRNKSPNSFGSFDGFEGFSGFPGFGNFGNFGKKTK